VKDQVNFVFADWSDLEEEVGEAILRWVYTDNVDLNGGDSHVLLLMKASGKFSLQELVNKYVTSFHLLELISVIKT